MNLSGLKSPDLSPSCSDLVKGGVVNKQGKGAEVPQHDLLLWGGGVQSQCYLLDSRGGLKSLEPSASWHLHAKRRDGGSSLSG